MRSLLSRPAIAFSNIFSVDFLQYTNGIGLSRCAIAEETSLTAMEDVRKRKKSQNTSRKRRSKPSDPKQTSPHDEV